MLVSILWNLSIHIKPIHSPIHAIIHSSIHAYDYYLAFQKSFIYASIYDYNALRKYHNFQLYLTDFQVDVKKPTILLKYM